MKTYKIITRDREKSEEVKQELDLKLKLIKEDINPDYVFAIGGDGTIISAIHRYPNAIIFGIHTGHLGFFANYSPNEIDEIVNEVNTNTFKVEELDLLSVNVVLDDDTTINDFAVNEATLVSPLRTLIVDVSIDNEYLEKFRGTGLCISTPYGSTAYNKSLHGSVVDTTIKTIQLTEIAGINSNAYRTLSSPLILNDKRVITLTGDNYTDLFLTVDHLSYNVSNMKSMVIKYAGKSAKIAYNSHVSFLSRLNRTFLISKD